MPLQYPIVQFFFSPLAETIWFHRTNFIRFLFLYRSKKKKENTRPLLRALCLNKLSHVRNRQKLHVFFFPVALKKRAARALSGQN